MNNQIKENFSEFHDQWMGKTGEYMKDLMKVLEKGKNGSTEQEQEALVSKMTAHIKEYYAVKWAAARVDVLVFFSPVWLSSFEMACSWVTGWRPSSMFRLVESDEGTRLTGASLVELTEEQVRKLEQRKVRIKLDEENVEREIGRHQIGLADRKMRRLGRAENQVRYGGETVREAEGIVTEAGMEVIRFNLEKIMKNADCARLKTMNSIMEILTPLQRVDFLAASFMMQVRLREWGNRLAGNDDGSSSRNGNGENE